MIFRSFSPFNIFFFEFFLFFCGVVCCYILPFSIQCDDTPQKKNMLASYPTHLFNSEAHIIIQNCYLYLFTENRTHNTLCSFTCFLYVVYGSGVHVVWPISLYRKFHDWITPFWTITQIRSVKEYAIIRETYWPSLLCYGYMYKCTLCVWAARPITISLKKE